MILEQTLIKQQLKEQLGLDTETAKIIVVGLGVTGNSVARYLLAIGFNFAIADSCEQPSIAQDLRESLKNTPLMTGMFNEDEFKNATHLIVSPGVPLTERAIAVAVQNGVEVLGDIDLFACSTNSPVVGITGSNGKSTVTTMVGEMAKASGVKVGVGGNLGLPALDLLREAAELYVLELSSFQLERTRLLKTVAATVLNITADHLDRHTTITEYAEQKQKIFVNAETMVINLDDPMVLAMREKSRRTLTFSITQEADFDLATMNGHYSLMNDARELLPLSELPLEGRHNAANALAAFALGFAIGLDVQAMCVALKQFKGLAHRMQRIAQIRGITWVNDSKATNIGACVAALHGYDYKVILIAGGDAKGADMTELAPVLKAKAKSVILMGKDADLIEQVIGDSVPIYKAANMQEAVNIADSIALAGDSVLLSPACASLDQYKNYQDRGDQFAKAVLRLAA